MKFFTLLGVGLRRFSQVDSDPIEKQQGAEMVQSDSGERPESGDRTRPTPDGNLDAASEGLDGAVPSLNASDPFKSRPEFGEFRPGYRHMIKR
jgi:hypothetical protein